MQVIISIDVENMQDAIYTMHELMETLDNNNYPDAGPIYISASDETYDHSAHVCGTCECPPSQHIKNVPGTNNGKPYCLHHQRQCSDMKVISGH